jgi:hypothetical protein
VTEPFRRSNLRLWHRNASFGAMKQQHELLFVTFVNNIRSGECLAGLVFEARHRQLNCGPD